MFNYMNYIYGWKLEYFRGKMFNDAVPKSIRDKKTYDILDLYFDTDSISVFKTAEGNVLGVYMAMEGDFDLYALSLTLRERVKKCVELVTTSDFSMFLILNDPQIVEAKL